MKRDSEPLECLTVTATLTIFSISSDTWVNTWASFIVTALQMFLKSLKYFGLYIFLQHIFTQII